MAHIPRSFGTVSSKYDCLLGANLNDELPVDRHVFCKRLRAWAIINNRQTALDASHTTGFVADAKQAQWTFAAFDSNGQSIAITCRMMMPANRNEICIEFR